MDCKFIVLHCHFRRLKSWIFWGVLWRRRLHQRGGCTSLSSVGIEIKLWRSCNCITFYDGYPYSGKVTYMETGSSLLYIGMGSCIPPISQSHSLSVLTFSQLSNSVGPAEREQLSLTNIMRYIYNGELKSFAVSKLEFTGVNDKIKSLPSSLICMFFVDVETYKMCSHFLIRHKTFWKLGHHESRIKGFGAGCLSQAVGNLPGKYLHFGPYIRSLFRSSFISRKKFPPV